MLGSVAAFEATITLQDGKRHRKRILVEGQPVDQAMSGLLARLQSPTTSGGTVA
jgi:hypothetical protein